MRGEPLPSDLADNFRIDENSQFVIELSGVEIDVQVSCPSVCVVVKGLLSVYLLIMTYWSVDNDEGNDFFFKSDICLEV